MAKPRTLAVTFDEGGDWVTPADAAFYEGRPVHSIRFSDHSVWDVVNGWRSFVDHPEVLSPMTRRSDVWVTANG